MGKTKSSKSQEIVDGVTVETTVKIKRGKSLAFKLNKMHKEMIDKKATALNLNTTDYLLFVNNAVKLDAETILKIQEFSKIELTLPRDFTLSFRVNENEKELLLRNVAKVSSPKKISQADFMTCIGLLAEIEVTIKDN